MCYVLCEIIQSNNIVNSIKISQEEFKMSQFANDAIFMDGSENSLQQILNILEVFLSLLGLKINMSKRKIFQRKALAP